jgi:surfeit locus 1 family protein
MPAANMQSFAVGDAHGGSAGGLLDGENDVPPRSKRARMVFALLAAAGVALLSGLGTWQLERRAWKLDLIDRVEQRVHQVPFTAPGPAAWPSINVADDAYRHISVSGRFLDVAPALALAVTARGGGYWVIAPFRTSDGFTVLVNRGFVPSDRTGWPDLRELRGETTISGLLRISEPGGGFLRHNDPAADRWYSRDVEAIAQHRGLRDVAPYFIDADASAASPSQLPIGGLTVIAFPNNHLVYALTWFGLAAMLAAWSVMVARGAARSGLVHNPLPAAPTSRPIGL